MQKNRPGEPAVRTGLVTDLFGFKCCFCGARSRKDMDVVSWTVQVPNYDDYGPDHDDEVRFRAYHPLCLNDVLCDPESYGHQKTDMALEIVSRLERRKFQERAHAIFLLKGKVAELKENDERNKRAKEAYNKLNSLL